MRDEVDALGRVAREDDLAGEALRNEAISLRGALISGGGLVGERVHAPVDVWP